MSTVPLAPLAPLVTVVPAGQEWWREGLHTWHARTLQAEAEAEALWIELAAERRCGAELQAQLKAASTSR